MGLTSKVILLCCDDAELTSKVLLTLKPVVKQVTPASSGSEAWSRLAAQTVDCVLYRSKVPKLGDPNEIFGLTQKNRSFKNIPWVVLGTDIEDPKFSAKHPNVKFLAQAEDSLGLLRLLDEVCESGASAQATEENNGHKLDARIINTLMSAVVEVTKDVSGVQFNRGAPVLRKATDPATAAGDISGIVTMNTERFRGSFSISFPEPLVMKLYRLSAEKSKKLSDGNIKTVLLELTTLMFNQAKKDLSAIGYDLTPAAPKIISGKGHELPHATDGVRFSIPFESQVGACTVECVIVMNKK